METEATAEPLVRKLVWHREQTTQDTLRGRVAQA